MLSALVPRVRWSEIFPVTPATLLNWHRRLVAGKYTAVCRIPGRPLTGLVVKALILWVAGDNLLWGREWIQRELTKPGHRIAKSSVGWILEAAGVDPVARRGGPIWRWFLRSQARTVIATDFLHVDTILLRRIYVLAFIEHGTRRLRVVGLAAHPEGAWSARRAGNLAGAVGEWLARMRFLVGDRGGNFTASFGVVFEGCGLWVLRSPPQASRANAVCECLIGTLRREVLDKILIVSGAYLRAVLAEYVAHYNAARPRQGIAQRVPGDDVDHLIAKVIDLETARIRRGPILGGITSEYEAAA